MFSQYRENHFPLLEFDSVIRVCRLQIFREQNEIKGCVHFIILAISTRLLLFHSGISEIMTIMYFARILEVLFITAHVAQ